MSEPPDLIAATLRMDLAGIKRCLEGDPNSIAQVDGNGNNAMHICVGGGSPRMRPIMEFLVEETSINLLHKNRNGDAPIDLAIAINDQEAMSFLYEPTIKQLHAENPDPEPDIHLV